MVARLRLVDGERHEPQDDDESVSTPARAIAGDVAAQCQTMAWFLDTLARAAEGGAPIGSSNMRAARRCWDAFAGAAGDQLFDLDEAAKIHRVEQSPEFVVAWLAESVGRIDMGRLSESDRRCWLADHLARLGEAVERGASAAHTARRLTEVYVDAWPIIGRRMRGAHRELVAVLATPRRGRAAGIRLLFGRLGLADDEDTLKKARRRARKRLGG